MTAPLILRIYFKSGRVSEERGCEEDLEALFASDPDKILDYVISLDPENGTRELYFHVEDERVDCPDLTAYGFSEA